MQTGSGLSIFRRSGGINRLWVVALAAGLVATAVDLIIAAIVTPIVYAPADYPSFSWLPILTGCLIGAFGACAVYSFLLRQARRPVRAFLIASIVVLILSYGLPIMPIMNPLPRFAGVNWGIAFALMFIHTVTASIIVSSLLILGKPASRVSQSVEPLR